MYSSVADVRQASGLKAKDLRFASEAEFDVWLAARLEEISDLIDQRIAAKFQGDNAPPGIHGIARQVAQNLIANVVAVGQTPIVRISDWQVRVSEARIFSPEILDALHVYRDRPPVRMFRVQGKSS